MELELPVSVIRHDTGVHAFDLEEDSAECHAVIDRVLEGLAACLQK